MLIEIYSSILETAKNIDVPKHIEMVFHINDEISTDFWSNPAHKKEREILFEEWDAGSERTYTKVFYGIKFGIKFNQ